MTWLDLYSATNNAPTRRHSTRLKGRVDKIKETLEVIKWKIDIRRQLVGLADNNGAYCTTCSLDPDTAYCSATCPLRRGRPDSWLKRDTAWIYFARQDVELYDKLHCDVVAFGSETDKQEVVKWEVTCKDLQQRTEDTQQRYSARISMLPVRGLDQCWRFEGRWGKGPGIQAELAPGTAKPPVFDGIESPILHRVGAPARVEAQELVREEEPESVASSGLNPFPTIAEWWDLVGFGGTG